jgi:ABC-type transport system involved in Fe-S cluster assembly fused permease/ATPase subunit
MQDQSLSDKIINLRRMSAEYYQKAAWNQLLALDNYRENNFVAAERFAQLSFEDQMNAMEYAELADAESLLFLDLNIEEEC